MVSQKSVIYTIYPGNSGSLRGYEGQYRSEQGSADMGFLGQSGEMTVCAHRTLGQRWCKVPIFKIFVNVIIIEITENFLPNVTLVFIHKD